MITVELARELRVPCLLKKLLLGAVGGVVPLGPRAAAAPSAAHPPAPVPRVLHFDRALVQRVVMRDRRLDAFHSLLD